MSHNTPDTHQNGYQTNALSPWTECFQSNPMHRSGHYDNGYLGNGHADDQNPRVDEAQAPTWHALSVIYGTDERE